MATKHPPMSTAPNGHVSIPDVVASIIDELDAASAVSLVPAQDVSSRRKLLHASDLKDLPKSDWLIEGVLPTNKLTEVFGMPGHGKSFLNLDIALSVAQFANVIYIAAEDAEDYEARVAAWCLQHKVGPGGLHFWPEAVNLFDQTSVDAFLAEAAPINPALIVIDPLANCMVGGDESSTKDMTIAIHALNSIRRQTHAAILISHHTGWNDAHERGSSVLRGACRVVMKLTNNDGFLTLTCEKVNATKAFAPRYFQLVPAGDSVVLTPTTKITQRDAPLSQKQLDVLEALHLSIFAHGATFTQLVEHLNIAKSSLNYSLARLKDRGCILQEGRGSMQRYRLTDSGAALLLTKESEVVQSSSVQVTLRLNNTELTLNWHVRSEVIPTKVVQSHMASPCASSAEFSPSSVSVQSNGSSSVQSAPLNGAERLNRELNGTSKPPPEQPTTHTHWPNPQNGGAP